VSDPELASIAESARDLAYRQLDAQLQSSDNFDAKAMGVLGFDGAAVAGIVAARDVFGGAWVVPGLLVLISSVLAILAMQRFAWDVGPDPRQFYEDSVADGVKPGAAARANVQLISELGGQLGSIARNEGVLHLKSWFFLGSLLATMIAGLVGAILIAMR